MELLQGALRLEGVEGCGRTLIVEFRGNPIAGSHIVGDSHLIEVAAEVVPPSASRARHSFACSEEVA